ncbi:hypothetical protein [Janibacter sp. GS2]|uniref:hypothetical protein n=1 Tax=Janibacter sp. GS2 TaxID=3442646 RepID=UPI003EBCA64A
MSTARTTSTHTSPTDLPEWAIPVEDLEAMLATDDDTVDTAAIPRLAYRDAVEESAAPGAASMTASPVINEAPHGTATSDHVAPPLGHSLRRRHASPESVAAIRRNLVAVACVVLSVVLLGAGVAWLAGWIGLVAYALLVIGASVMVHRTNAGYAPRHSHYAPRHA